MDYVSLKQFYVDAGEQESRLKERAEALKRNPYRTSLIPALGTLLGLGLCISSSLGIRSILRPFYSLFGGKAAVRRFDARLLRFTIFTSAIVAASGVTAELIGQIARSNALEALDEACKKAGEFETRYRESVQEDSGARQEMNRLHSLSLTLTIWVRSEKLYEAGANTLPCSLVLADKWLERDREIAYLPEAKRAFERLLTVTD